MTQYWLITQWPHHQGEPWHVYVRPEYRAKGEQLQVGDLVFFYETTTNGGRGGIVGQATVVAPIRHRVFDGDDGGWTHEVPCGNHRTGWIRREDVLKIIHRGNVRVAGGIIPLSGIYVDALRRAFKGERGT